MGGSHDAGRALARRDGFLHAVPTFKHPCPHPKAGKPTRRGPGGAAAHRGPEGLPPGLLTGEESAGDPPPPRIVPQGAGAPAWSRRSFRGQTRGFQGRPRSGLYRSDEDAQRLLEKRPSRPPFGDHWLDPPQAETSRTKRVLEFVITRGRARGKADLKKRRQKEQGRSGPAGVGDRKRVRLPGSKLRRTCSGQTPTGRPAPEFPGSRGDSAGRALPNRRSRPQEPRAIFLPLPRARSSTSPSAPPPGHTPRPNKERLSDLLWRLGACRSGARKFSRKREDLRYGGTRGDSHDRTANSSTEGPLLSELPDQPSLQHHAQMIRRPGDLYLALPPLFYRAGPMAGKRGSTAADRRPHRGKSCWPLSSRAGKPGRSAIQGGLGG